VFVSIPPQEFLVRRIGGEHVQVEVLVEPGHSPATYAPTPRQMARLAHADLYFRIGVPFENSLVPKIKRSIPGLVMADLREGIELLHLEEDHADHGGEGDLDPHTWLDPLLALRQAETVRDSLVRHAPQWQDEYRRNYEKLANDLRELDGRLRQILAPYGGSAIYVFHPAFGYFCRAYNLRQIAIHQGGKEPGARHVAELIDRARQDQVRVIFVQPQFSDKAAKALAKSINGRIVALDPLAADYLANMEEMARQLAEVLTERSHAEQDR
jgi:zinc transport system substrate-binding protein